MSTETFDPSVASGANRRMRGSRPLELNEVSLNGDGSAKEISSGTWQRQGGYFLQANPDRQSEGSGSRQ